MKLENTASTIETNITDTKRLVFKNTPKIFSLFSDNLYSNKIGSIVRELACNAKDSHIAARNENPFDIILPNGLDPSFRVRDYGTGMSEDDVKNIFSCYGESTKTDSNDYVGAFGIGSKTPFAYSDNFNVISRYNGKEMFFTVYIDSEGFPTISKLGETETTERNGIEVNFPVEEKDFIKFKDETENQLKYFDFPYKVNGKEPKKTNIAEAYPIVYSDENCIIKSAGYYRQSVSCLVGGICYYVNHENFESFGFHVLLKLKIGSVDLSASRENLAYTEKTLKMIEKSLAKAKENMTSHVYHSCKSIPTKFERSVYYHKHYSNLYINKFQEVFNVFASSINHNISSYKNIRVYNETNKPQKSLYFNISGSRHQKLEIYTAPKRPHHVTIDSLTKRNMYTCVITGDYESAQNEIETLLKEIDSENVIFHNSYPEVERVERQPRKNIDKEIYCYKDNKGSKTHINDEHHYFLKKSTLYFKDGDDYDFKSFEYFDKKIYDLDVVYFKKADFKRAEKAGYLEKMTDGISYIKELIAQAEIDPFKHISMYRLITGIAFDILNKIDHNEIEDIEFAKYFESAKNTKLKNMFSFFTSNVDLSEYRKDVHELQQKYSFLTHFSSYSYFSDDDIKKITKIINMIHKNEI